MKKSLNLRQVEAFKAVIEHGTVSRAAEALFVSQPAVSKQLVKLEEDTGLALFDRVRGKLAPTRHGMRLYEEIDRIFAGLRQVEQAIDSIRRDEQRHLEIGVMPALSGSFVRRVTMNFMKAHPNVHVSIQTRSSQFLADWLVTRQIDVALVGSRVENPYIDREPLISSPLFCAMHIDHPLTKKRIIRAGDLDGLPFVSFATGSQTDQLVRKAFSAVGAELNSVLDTVTAPTVCEFVAAGLGVSLIHPLFAEGTRGRIALRRFDPEIFFKFQLCSVRASRNASLIEAFMQEARLVAQEVSDELLHGQ
ncbi:LysR substrate-binding domain-containing protein [Pollutimonas bauzanensis]|uniref:DNA-binding transcriptional regulator, LysR family n=1 Tax=Pollutimonas bauzanensis TaxID=658167 RepID=A0A1M5ZTZ8_9BURK|nr:LysR substrate-binding domain-containing protein [Pollutimonas bauzanensis]SHI27539.1 DNA-binding transcriptional regulator, LysR family [Pollutimonas bauzanensis]